MPGSRASVFGEAEGFRAALSADGAAGVLFTGRLVSFRSMVDHHRSGVGSRSQRAKIITVGPGERLHARIAGPCHWGAIQVPDQQLADFARALSGTGFFVPAAARWQPSRAAVRQLRHLRRAAIRMAEAPAGALSPSFRRLTSWSSN